MTSTVVKSETKLTDYEQAQVEKIASWKASHPNAFGELFHRVARPVARFFEFIVPDAVALGAIEAVYKASDLAATQEDIKLQAGVADLSELRQKPMQVCDELSRRFGSMGQGVATLEGAPRGLVESGPPCSTCLCYTPCASPRSSRQGIATATGSIGPLTKRGSWGP